MFAAHIITQLCFQKEINLWENKHELICKNKNINIVCEDLLK